MIRPPGNIFWNDRMKSFILFVQELTVFPYRAVHWGLPAFFCADPEIGRRAHGVFENFGKIQRVVETAQKSDVFYTGNPLLQKGAGMPDAQCVQIFPEIRSRLFLKAQEIYFLL